jgi:peptide deformylase
MQLLAIRLIHRHPHPVLREKAVEVKEITPHVLSLLDDMVQTMYEAEGVGLAAPQVGISKRVIVVDIKDENGLLKLINPVIVERSGREKAVEGCLSFPNLAGEVDRDIQVTVNGQDPQGNSVQICASGLLARALQHEIDHLDGVLFVDRVTRFVEQQESKEK